MGMPADEALMAYDYMHKLNSPACPPSFRRACPLSMPHTNVHPHPFFSTHGSPSASCEIKRLMVIDIVIDHVGVGLVGGEGATPLKVQWP